MGCPSLILYLPLAIVDLRDRQRFGVVGAAAAVGVPSSQREKVLLVVAASKSSLVQSPSNPLMEVSGTAIKLFTTISRRG